MAIGPNKRRRIYERDSYSCRYCGAVALEEPTLDHVHPKSRGGSDETSNLVTCCKPCQIKKSNKTPEEAGMPLRRPELEIHPFVVKSLSDIGHIWRLHNNKEAP